MADHELRALERRAAEGDEAAASELVAAMRRSGQGEPPCERCATWHPPMRESYCFGPINLERAREIAQAQAERDHPLPTRRGKPVNMSPRTEAQLQERRARSVEGSVAWVEAQAEGGHLLSSLRACDGCQAFLVVNRSKLHRWTGDGTWRDRAKRAISIVQLLLPPCATPAEKRAKLAHFRVRAQGDAWTSKVWQEEVRRAFPELAREKKPRKALLVPGEVARDELPLFRAGGVLPPM